MRRLQPCHRYCCVGSGASFCKQVISIENSTYMTVPDLDLQAYVDGELTDNERATIDKHILKSEALFEAVGALRSVKKLVRLAYATRAIPDDIG